MACGVTTAPYGPLRLNQLNLPSIQAASICDTSIPSFQRLHQAQNNHLKSRVHS
jgi:hypothetical protein